MKYNDCQVKPVLMIHEISEEMLSLPLHEYTLTFDDGLYSQYQYLDQLKNIDTDKIFFISSGIICTGEQNTEFITCRNAHVKAFNGNFENYMTIDQIKEISNTPKCYIGGHSHSHLRVSLNTHSLRDIVNHVKQDTDKMVNWFDEHLGKKIEKFCFPYNDDLTKMYPAILKQYQITETYGRERIPIETLLRN